MSHDGNQVQVSFCPVPMLEVQAEIFSSGVASADSSPNSSNPNVSAMKEQGEKPKFGPRPEFSSLSFDFKKELEWVPFPVNFGEVELSQSQQKCFLELIYDHQSVFSLCDKDLGLCDCLKYTIPTTMSKPVYLPHCIILV